MKKILIALWCLLLLILPVCTAAAEELSAVNVVVLQIEGTVDVANQSGNQIPVFNNMKLHSGYDVSTMDRSYAWMSLDDVKVAGLDADSNVAVKKQGKQLVLLLDEGNMFFDVKQKLESDETMNVRTSNMVMGIRGTFGVVRAIDSRKSDVLCLDGNLDIRIFNPVSGISEEINLVPGEIATFSVTQEETIDVEIRRYEPEEIDGFVLRYLNGNPETLERVAANGGGNLKVISDEWETRLEQDQQERAEAKESIHEDESDEVNIDYWEKSDPCINGHSFNSAIVTAATCKKKGIIRYTCSRCFYSYDESIGTVAHAARTVKGSEATCTEAGSTAGSICKVCEKWLSKPETIPALGHNYSSSTVTEPTCTQKGTKRYTCSRCSHSYDESIDTIAHVAMTVEASDATCTEAGSTAGSVCKICNEWLVKSESVPALGHDYNSEVITEADCMNTGITRHTCNRCSYSYDETTAITDHTAGTLEAIDATCTEEGRTSGTVCEVCETWLVEPEIIPALGHNYILEEPTMEGSIEIYVCDRCGDTYEVVPDSEVIEEPDL